jgi:hypothetical protein
MSQNGDQKRPSSKGTRKAPTSGTVLASAEVDVTPFNPLDTTNLGIAVAKALLGKTAHPLLGLPPFRGAGIYAIYYRGGFQPYAALTKANAAANNPSRPIYVGKAIPKGGRKGAFNTTATDTSTLYGRLREHAESVQAAKNLDSGDFTCRLLVVHDLWIPLAEQLLIAHFAPIWNRLIDGFGNHDPGAGRYNGLRPRWDVLHPGRHWAEKCKQRSETAEDISRETEQYLSIASVPSLGLLAGDMSGK